MASTFGSYSVPWSVGKLLMTEATLAVNHLEKVITELSTITTGYLLYFIGGMETRLIDNKAEVRTVARSRLETLSPRLDVKSPFSLNP